MLVQHKTFERNLPLVKSGKNLARFLPYSVKNLWRVCLHSPLPRNRLAAIPPRALISPPSASKKGKKSLGKHLKSGALRPVKSQIRCVRFYCSP